MLVKKLIEIVKVIQILNIMDLQIWGKITKTVFENAHCFGFTLEFLDFLRALQSYQSKFHYKNTDFTRHKFIFDEKDMLAILNKNLISVLFKRLQTLSQTSQQTTPKNQHQKKIANPSQSQNTSEIINNSIIPTVDLDLLSLILNKISDIVNRFSKIHYLNYFEQREFLKNFEQVILRSFHQISMANKVMLYLNFLRNGINNAALTESFEKHFTENLTELQQLDDEFLLNSFISAWKNNGSHSPVLYDKLIRKIFLQKVRNTAHSRDLSMIAFDAITAKILDRDLWKMILSKVQNIEVANCRIFDKRALHTSMKLLQIRIRLDSKKEKVIEKDEKDNELLFMLQDTSVTGQSANKINQNNKQMILLQQQQQQQKLWKNFNQLSKMCIGMHFEQDFTNLFLKQHEESRFSVKYQQKDNNQQQQMKNNFSEEQGVNAKNINNQKNSQQVNFNAILQSKTSATKTPNNNNNTTTVARCKLIDCCNETTILDYKNTYENQNAIRLQQGAKYKKFVDQNYEKSQQEKWILAGLKQLFQECIDEEVSLVEDQMICLFKIDLAIIFKKTGEKVALEISGLCYTFENGQILGKKQNKKQLLEYYGWKTIMFNIGERKINNLLAQMNQNSLQNVLGMIREQIEKELGRKLATNKADKQQIAKNQPAKQIKTKKMLFGSNVKNLKPQQQ